MLTSNTCKHPLQHQNRSGSIAFEYVVVTLMGIGISLVVMQVAKNLIQDKLSSMQDQLDNKWTHNWEEHNSSFSDDF